MNVTEVLEDQTYTNSTTKWLKENRYKHCIVTEMMECLKNPRSIPKGPYNNRQNLDGVLE